MGSCRRVEHRQTTHQEIKTVSEITGFYEAKYKAIRGAFRAMSKMHRQDEEARKKNRDRIISLCHDLIAIGTADPSITHKAERILLILGANPASKPQRYISQTHP